MIRRKMLSFWVGLVGVEGVEGDGVLRGPWTGGEVRPLGEVGMEAKVKAERGSLWVFAELGVDSGREIGLSWGSCGPFDSRFFALGADEAFAGD